VQLIGVMRRSNCFGIPRSVDRSKEAGTRWRICEKMATNGTRQIDIRELAKGVSRETGSSSMLNKIVLTMHAVIGSNIYICRGNPKATKQKVKMANVGLETLFERVWEQSPSQSKKQLQCMRTRASEAIIK